MAAVLRIGCGCGFWGDSAAGPVQLVAHGNIDVLVLDYLSEITLSLLARARRRRPELGYTPDFISDVMRPLAAQIAARGIKVVANAGGVNPQACRDALQKALDELGVRLSVAVVLGDDISAQVDAAAGCGRHGHGERRPAAVPGHQRECLSRGLSDRAGTGRWR